MSRDRLRIVLRTAAALTGLCLVAGLLLAGLHAHAQPSLEGHGCPACALVRSPGVPTTASALPAPPRTASAPLAVEPASATLERRERPASPRGPPTQA